MKYSMSQTDRRNFDIFKNNSNVNTLLSIEVKEGIIRGVSKAKIEFKYPITAVVGRNGAGKSTLLSLIACAYHNNDKKFIPFSHISKKDNGFQHYYTYNDFFVFTENEVGIENIVIESQYLSKSGVKSDVRRKTNRWNRYETRPKRRVSYLGISRIIPPSESNSHKTYRSKFLQRELSPKQIDKIKEALKKVFSTDYSELSILSCREKSYRLSKVKKTNVEYSGFNMGAGENAVCILLSEILLAGSGSLIVVDEIELGLHVEAQKNLIDVLKEWCNEYKIQIVLSTHSNSVLDRLPPEARIYIDSRSNPTIIESGISSEYAFGKLSGDNCNELSILVEDSVAKIFLETLLPIEIRERVKIKAIGSANAVLRHGASYYKEKRPFLIYLDGDKRSINATNLTEFCSAMETLPCSKDEFVKIITKYICYIPGEQNPERYILTSLYDKVYYPELIAKFGVSEFHITNAFESGIIADKHYEFSKFAKAISINDDKDVLKGFCEIYKKHYSVIVNEICRYIRGILAEN